MQRLQNRGPQRLHVPRVGAAWISRSTSATWRLTQSRLNPCRLESLEWMREACAQATKGGGSGQQQSRMSLSCPRQPESSSSELAENFLRWHDVDTGDSLDLSLISL